MHNPSNGDDPSEEEEPFPAQEDGSEPTQQFLPYESALPPLSPRRPQPADYGLAAPASKSAPAAYEMGAEEPRAPRGSVTFGIAKFNQFLKWLLSVIEVMFALRVVLKLLGASKDNPFIHLLYSSTDPLLAPFTAALGKQTTSVEWDTLLAMLVYFLVIVALIRFLRLFVTDPEL